MWQLLGTLVANPSYLIIVALIGLSTWLYVQDTYHKSQIADLKKDVVVMEQNYNTCKGNEVTLKGAVDEIAGEFNKLQAVNKMLEGKIIEEKKRVEYWKAEYQNKKCFNNGDEEPVRPETGKVLNDEKSVEAIRAINALLGVK